jgi:perosamine synthetase
VKTVEALALEGGRPSVAEELLHNWPEITPDDRLAINAVLDRGELWGPDGPEVTALQREWSKYVGTRFCVVTNSGTAALHCAVVASGLEPGDEVIMPAFSFVATPMAVLHHGALPVFCDIDPVTYTIDPARVEELITDRTRAIMPVHVHGLPADMDALREIASKHGLVVIEDAAQAHGACYRGSKVGALGLAGAFSLNGSKNLSAGEGGLFVTDDEEAFVAARRLAIFGEDTPRLNSSNEYRAYWSHGVGWNYRGHELTAALARSQLRRLDHYNETAQRNAAALSKALGHIPGVKPPHIPSDRTCVFYRYRVRLEPRELGISASPQEFRDRILHALHAEGVPATLWQLMPLPVQPVFRRGSYGPWQPGQRPTKLDGWDRDAFPETVRLFASSIVLGTHVHPLFNQTTEAIEACVHAFAKIFTRIDAVLGCPYVPATPRPSIPPGDLD